MAEYIDREVLNRYIIKNMRLVPINWKIHFANFVRTVPASDAAPVHHAHYVHLKYHNDFCSNCKRARPNIHDQINYCPYCGAMMDGVDDEGR